jgi:hypothetical protein
MPALHEVRDLLERHVLRNRNHMVAHHIADDMPVLLQIPRGLLAGRRRQKFEPPRALPVAGAGLHAMQQVALADDADDLSIPFASTTGMPLIRLSTNSLAASWIVMSGVAVTTDRIMMSSARMGIGKDRRLMAPDYVGREVHEASNVTP